MLFPSVAPKTASKCHRFSAAPGSAPATSARAASGNSCQFQAPPHFPAASNFSEAPFVSKRPAWKWRSLALGRVWEMCLGEIFTRLKRLADGSQKRYDSISRAIPWKIWLRPVPGLWVHNLNHIPRSTLKIVVTCEKWWFPIAMLDYQRVQDSTTTLQTKIIVLLLVLTKWSLIGWVIHVCWLNPHVDECPSLSAKGLCPLQWKSGLMVCFLYWASILNIQKTHVFKKIVVLCHYQHFLCFFAIQFLNTVISHVVTLLPTCQLRRNFLGR